MNNISNDELTVRDPKTRTALSARVSSLALASISAKTQNLAAADVRRSLPARKRRSRTLVDSCGSALIDIPNVSELRVLLGMALCVNLEAQAAIEELEESVRLAPNSFIAHLKMGELWMRLRAIDKAEEHTRPAGLLAQNLAQSELARRQAATIRTMRRDGIERGGYKSPWSWITRPLRRLWTRNRREPSVALDIS